MKGTKAKFITLSPEEHDYLTGVISHFPHVIAASLVHQAEKTSQEQKLMTRFAAGGFRDITRIASSSPEMWRDILLHNKDVLLKLLKEWQQEMEEVTTMLEHQDGEEIYQYFAQAKNFRDELPQKQMGAIPAFYDFLSKFRIIQGLFLKLQDIWLRKKSVLQIFKLEKLEKTSLGCSS